MDLVNNSDFGEYFLHGQAKQGIQQGQDAGHKGMFVEFGLVGRCHRHIEQVRGQHILMRTTYAALLLLPGAACPFSLLLLSIRCLIFYVAAVGALAILFLLIRHLYRLATAMIASVGRRRVMRRLPLLYPCSRERGPCSSPSCPARP